MYKNKIGEPATPATLATLEADLNRILAQLRYCSDPEVEDALQAELEAKMELHTALWERLE